MEKKTRSIKKSITILTILALLVLILPVAVMAKAGGYIPALPEQASEDAKQEMINRLPNLPDSDDLQEDEDKEEDIKEEEEAEGEVAGEDEKSERAVLVEARNAWAEANGIPPGHANLFFKYLTALGVTEDFVVDTVLVEDPTKMDTLNELLLAYQNAEDPMSIKELQAKIKEVRKGEPELSDEVAPEGNMTAQQARAKIKIKANKNK